MKQDKLLWRLEHIREAAELALDLAKGQTLESFFENSTVENAVTYQLIIVGEAAAVIIKKYPEVVAEHTEIPWFEMRTLRNILVHEYHREFSDESWITVSERLPQIYLSIVQLIKDLDKN